MVDFLDTFTVASNEALTSHTPDTGTGWALAHSTYTADAIYAKATGGSGAAQVCGPGTNQNSAGVMALASPDPAGAEYDVEAAVYSHDWTLGNSYNRGLVARKQSGVVTGYYAQVLLNGHTDNSLILGKSVNGVATELASMDVTFANGDLVRLEVRDAAKKVFVNGVEQMSSADNAITGAGSCGLFFGNVMGRGSHIDRRQEFDNFAYTVASANQQYQQAVAGAVALAAAVQRSALRALAGTLALAAGLARRPARSLGAALAASGVASKRAGRSVAGAVVPAATTRRAVGRSVAGSLPATGAVNAVRTFLRALAGSLVPAGTVTRVVAFARSASGALLPAGAVGTIRLRVRALSGALPTAGALARTATLARGLNGLVGLAGGGARQVSRQLTGTMPSAAALVISRAVMKTLVGTLALSGGIQRVTARRLDSVVIFAGARGKALRRALAGTLAPVADVLGRLASQLVTPARVLVTEARLHQVVATCVSVSDVTAMETSLYAIRTSEGLPDEL